MFLIVVVNYIRLVSLRQSLPKWLPWCYTRVLQRGCVDRPHKLIIASHCRNVMSALCCTCAFSLIMWACSLADERVLWLIDISECTFMWCTWTHHSAVSACRSNRTKMAAGHKSVVMIEIIQRNDSQFNRWNAASLKCFCRGGRGLSRGGVVCHKEAWPVTRRRGLSVQQLLLWVADWRLWHKLNFCLTGE